MELTVTLGGRDDNYGENFIERLNQALSSNLISFDKSGIDYEIIMVDFNPLDGYLHEHPLLQEPLSHKRVRNIIVDNSVICKENLGTTTYYEYFAKNVGCRNSKGDMIVVTNSDIIFTDILIEQIKKELTNPEKDNFFYRARYRGEILLGTDPTNESPVEDLHHPEFPDACVCGMYSGDISMFSREVMFNIATGYNESEKRHRTHLSQSHMDGEILWNVYKKGKVLKFLEAPYYHIHHGPRPVRDEFYSQDTYENKNTWGFVKYKQEQVNENTIIIKK